MGSAPSSETAWPGESGSLFRLEAGESPSGFSNASMEAFKDACGHVFAVGVEGVEEALLS